MRDLAKRNALAEQLRLLIDGETGSEALENFLYEHDCLAASDRAVDEIAWWAWTLYCDPKTYRLRGKLAGGHDARAAAGRAALFLQSGLDYPWPSLQEPTAVFVLRWLTTNWWLVTFGCLLVSLWNFGAVLVGVTLGPLLLVATALAAVGCLAADKQAERLMRPQLDAFEAAGDKACWPFLNQEQLAEASHRDESVAS